MLNVFLCILFQEGSAWLRNSAEIIRAMPAAIAAAKPLFKMKFFCKHHVSFRCIIKINAFFQCWLHRLSVLPAIVYQYLPADGRVT